MIVPSSRLITWCAVIGLPFSVTAATVPGAYLLSIAVISGFLVLILIDVFRSQELFRGLQIELPERVRLAREQEGVIELKLMSEGALFKHLRIGLPFPEEIESEQESMSVQLPQVQKWFKAEWPCTPRKRGRYRIDRCYLETRSPFGFWTLRARRSSRMELQVYPNLREERNSVAALFLHRGGFGAHPQRLVGKGREFEKLREYISGDSYEDIHWKATAKRGVPVTKIYQIERTQEVYVVIDASRLSARQVPDILEHQPGNVSVLERFISAGLVLGLAAHQQGDLFGLTVFSNKVHVLLKAGHGKAHFNACRDALYTMMPETVSPDFEDVCSFIRTRLRKRSLLVFLTSLDDPVLAENFLRSVRLICKEHLILAMMIRPPLAQPLFSGPEVQHLDDIYRNLGGHVLWHKLREVERSLSHLGVQFEQAENALVTPQLVSRYMAVKQKQML